MGRSKTAEQLAVMRGEIEELRAKHSQAVEELRGCLEKGGCPVICGPGRNQQGIIATTPEDPPAGDKDEQLGCQADQG